VPEPVRTARPLASQLQNPGPGTMACEASPGELQCQTESRAMHTYSSPPVPPARRRGWSVSRPQYAVVAMAQGRWHRPWLAVSRLSNHHSTQTIALATSPALRNAFAPDATNRRWSAQPARSALHLLRLGPRVSAPCPGFWI
jgi:hypothetical protein